jgi:hypothetical protein
MSAANCVHACVQRLAAVEHAVDQADVFGLGRIKLAAGVGQLAGDALPHQLGQALQGAHVGHHADVDFLDGEERVAAAVAHVGAGDQVNAAADAAAMDGGQHGLAAALQAGEGVLHVEDDAAQLFAHAASQSSAIWLAQAHHHLQVDARR